MVGMDALIEHYGDGGAEDARLARSPHGRLEYLRTRELIRRWLPGSRMPIQTGSRTAFASCSIAIIWS